MKLQDRRRKRVADALRAIDAQKPVAGGPFDPTPLLRAGLIRVTPEGLELTPEGRAHLAREAA